MSSNQFTEMPHTIGYKISQGIHARLELAISQLVSG